jgi:hypothetical protein
MSCEKLFVFLHNIEAYVELFPRREQEILRETIPQIRNGIISILDGYRHEISVLRGQIENLNEKIRENAMHNLDAFTESTLSNLPLEPTVAQALGGMQQQAVIGMHVPPRDLVLQPTRIFQGRRADGSSSPMRLPVSPARALHAPGDPVYAPAPPYHEVPNFSLLEKLQGLGSPSLARSESMWPPFRGTAAVEPRFRGRERFPIAAQPPERCGQPPTSSSGGAPKYAPTSETLESWDRYGDGGEPRRSQKAQNPKRGVSRDRWANFTAAQDLKASRAGPAAETAASTAASGPQKLAAAERKRTALGQPAAKPAVRPGQLPSDQEDEALEQLYQLYNALAFDDAYTTCGRNV